MSIGNWKHRFYIHKKYLGQHYRVGCHMHMHGSWSPQDQWDFPRNVHYVGSLDTLERNLQNSSIQGVIWGSNEERPEENHSPASLLPVFLHSTFPYSCPHLPFLSPTLTFHPQTLFSKCELDSKAYDTCNLEERDMLHTPFCPIHSCKKYSNFICEIICYLNTRWHYCMLKIFLKLHNR